MPQSRRNGRAKTADKPHATVPPRLFRRKQDAVAALKWWLEGEWYYSHRYNVDGDPTLQCVKQANRDKEDMEIVILDIGYEGRPA